MCLAQYAAKNSLRDIEASLIAVEHKLYHSGISYAVPRNTLAKANEQRDWRIYLDFGQVLIKESVHCMPKIRSSLTLTIWFTLSIAAP